METPSDHEDRIRALEDSGGGGGVTDHGALTGNADDDHAQYLKEKASGGTAAETPTHTHSGAAEAGTVAHSDLTGLTTGDPHTQYQKESEKSAASGYASLDGSVKVPIAELPTGTSGTTVALGDAPAGAVTTHVAVGDPHTQYQKESEKSAASGYASLDGSVKVPIAEVPTGTSGTTVALGNHTHATGYATRATLSTTTASLANLATENGTLAFAAGYRLLKVDVDKACRVRVYNSSAQRTADASRAIGQNVDIATDHGLVLEYVATALIDAELSPTVDGYCPSGTDAYYAIENRSGSTGTVTVIFTWIRTE